MLAWGVLADEDPGFVCHSLLVPRAFRWTVHGTQSRLHTYVLGRKELICYALSSRKTSRSVPPGSHLPLWRPLLSLSVPLSPLVPFSFFFPPQTGPSQCSLNAGQSKTELNLLSAVWAPSPWNSLCLGPIFVFIFLPLHYKNHIPTNPAWAHTERPSHRSVRICTFHGLQTVPGCVRMMTVFEVPGVSGLGCES